MNYFLEFGFEGIIIIHHWILRRKVIGLVAVGLGCGISYYISLVRHDGHP
jgi:hypothetical protein